MCKDYMYNRYSASMQTDCSVDMGSGTIIKLHHSRDDIAGLQNSVDVSRTGTVLLSGNFIQVSVAESLIKLGKEVNVELYVHLWDKYAEIDDCTTPEEVEAVIWEYDIEQVYSIN